MNKPSLILALLAAGLLAGAADYLLTDNERPGWGSNTFKQDEPRLKTGATVSPVEAECSPEFVKTIAQNDFRVLIDGRRGPEGNCQAFGSWQAKNPYEAFVVDLKKPYEISRAVVWALFDQNRKTGEVEILASLDGKGYSPVQKLSFPEGLASGKENLGLPLELPFEKPVKARYILFRTKIAQGGKQQAVSEIALYGRDLDEAEAAAAIAVPESAAGAIVEQRLTDNPAGEIFPPAEKALVTGAKLSWVTEGPFGTKSQEMLDTGSRPDGKCRALLDGVRTGGPGQAFGNWGKQYYATFIVDLQAPYLITRAAIWSQQTKTQGFETFELLLSMDGEKYVSVGTVKCPDDLLNSKEKYGEPVELKLEKPAAARYLQFRVKKHPARMQMILSEIAAWGDNLPAGKEVSSYLPENQRPEVAVAIHGIGSGALKLDWAGFGSASQVKSYRVYRSDKPFAKINEEGVERIGAFDPKTLSMLVYPLTPGETKYYGVSAVYEEGEYPGAKTLGYTPPGPVDAKTFGDILAVNHFWGGGGARHSKRTREWETVALDLLADSPFKEIRWWESHPEVVLKFYERGIAVTTFSGKRNYPNGKALGIHLYGASNEPHLHGVQGADFAKRVAEIQKEMRAAVPGSLLYAPTVCLDGRSFDFLEKFYAAGAKDHFDVLDVHNYLGNTSEFVCPPGYPAGCPEGLFERIGKVKEIMKRYGDEAKPLITTEFGYTEVAVSNPSGEITPERKAEYLVRGLVIQHVLGFRRVFVYSFWDEGEDANYTEHFFGMVDYKMQKKPAFYACVELGRMLGECVLDSTMKGATEVDFGYVYKSPAGKFITVVWNGAGDMSGTFRTVPGTVTVTSMYGEKKQIKTAADGSFRMIYGTAPYYIESAAPAELMKTVKVEQAKPGDRVALTLLSPVIVTGAGRKAEIKATLANPTNEALEIKLSLETPAGETKESRTVKLAAGAKQEVSVPIPAAGGLILDCYELAINYEGKYESRTARETLFVRRLADKPGVSQAKMYGYKNNVSILADDALEVTVDPMRGGRILEILDRRTGANQITVPYDRLGGLGNIAFYFCIWDQVKAPRGFGIDRNAVYKVKTLADGIELTAENAGKLKAVKTLTLGGKGVLALKVRIDNLSQENVACSWYMHPEYTVGGEAVSHSDLLTLPVGGKEMQIPYWTGLGDRTTPEFTAGYWKLTSPSKRYEIRQDFSLEQFRKPRLWFGIGSCNFEMESSKGLELAPGKSWEGNLKWTFTLLK